MLSHCLAAFILSVEELVVNIMLVSLNAMCSFYCSFFEDYFFSHSTTDLGVFVFIFVLCLEFTKLLGSLG